MWRDSPGRGNTSIRTYVRRDFLAESRARHNSGRLEKLLQQMLLLVTIGGLASYPTSSYAATFLVEPDGSGDFETVQDAIDAAKDGDAIELADGTFTGAGNRDMDCLGKAITIRSQSRDARVCSIDVQASSTNRHRAFRFRSREGPDTTLEDITIANGWESGGAVRMDRQAHPTFLRCRFIDNSSRLHGGAVSADSCRSRFVECTFEGNSVADGDGGAVYLWRSSATFVNCVFRDNDSMNLLSGGAVYGLSASPSFQGCLFERNGSSAVQLLAPRGATVLDCMFLENSGFKGGALHISRGESTIDGCTFIQNEATSSGGAIYLTNSKGDLIRNSTFYGNSGDYGGSGIQCNSSSPRIENTIVAFGHGINDIHCIRESNPVLRCTNVYNGVDGGWGGCIEDQLGIEGNIASDPLFCDAESRNLTLSIDSPCAPSANPACGLIGAWPVACGPVPVGTVSWGQIKAEFKSSR